MFSFYVLHPYSSHYLLNSLTKNGDYCSLIDVNTVYSLALQLL